MLVGAFVHSLWRLSIEFRLSYLIWVVFLSVDELYEFFMYSEY